jgi:hypothetical protein
LTCGGADFLGQLVEQGVEFLLGNDHRTLGTDWRESAKEADWMRCERPLAATNQKANGIAWSKTENAATKETQHAE